ncbi:hypothetical protein H5410_020039 [Solanum commersonii]|uniref:Uncharacterized protein n=1 Tax=Solanum commersonii TaxID=4109 RepID=A0A9J5ZCZ5_SOLCO|nr:hypothetical protein H5410_020039 [Solanum commersonii]
MRGISIISFLLISLIIHEATARSIQQYDNSYKELFSQFKVSRELRGLKGKKAPPPPPDPNRASHMLVPPAYRHRSPPPPSPSPSEVPTSYS